MTMKIDELIQDLRTWDFSRGGPWNGHARAVACMKQAADEIERLQAEHARSSEQGEAGWQPVTTDTPRGTTLLLYGRQIKNDRSLITYKDPLVFTGYWDDIDSAWCSTGSTWEGPFFHVTHWKPLDAAPSIATVSGSTEGGK